MSRVVEDPAPRPGRRRRRLRWLGLASVAAAVGLVAGPAGVASAAPTSEVDQVEVHGQALSLVLSVADLPRGASLDPASLVLTIDGQQVPATATAPQQSDGTAQRQQSAVLVVDTSGSMAGASLAQAKQAANTFLGKVPANVAVGLVSFSDSPHIVVRPTTDRAAVAAQIAALQANGGTALYDAMSTGTALLAFKGDRLLVVLSDGADTASHGSLAALTQRLASSGVDAELVGFHTDAAQTATLQALANNVHGRLIPANDGNGLVAAFSTAANTFGTNVVVTATLSDPLATGDHVIGVAARFGPYPMGASTTYTVAPPPPPVPTESAAPAVVTATASFGWLLPPTLFAVFLALLLLGLVLLNPAPKDGSRQSLRRLDDYRSGANPYSVAPPPGVRPEAEEQGHITQAALDLSDRVVSRAPFVETLALRLDRADIHLRPNEYVLITACIGLGVTALTTLLVHNLLIGIVVGVVIALVGSHLYLNHKEHQRTKAFAEQLPDTLQLLASSIRTGFSFSQALDAAMRNGQQPMSGELNRALAEARLGAPLEDGLERVAERMDSEDLRWTVMAVRIQRQVGGNLAEVLANTAKTMRERAALRRHVHALAAEGRLSGIILVILPVLLFSYLFWGKRAYLSLLWTTLPGAVMSIGGVVLLVVGSLWMRKIAQVEV
jgi:tight adherence protein B